MILGLGPSHAGKPLLRYIIVKLFSELRVMARDDGYLLLEAIVAIAIFTASIGAFYAIFGSSARMLQRAERESLAVELARARMAAIGTEKPVAPGTSIEKAENGLRVETAINLTGVTAGVGRYVTKSYWVTVDVFDETLKVPSGQIRLSTIKLVRSER